MFPAVQTAGKALCLLRPLKLSKDFDVVFNRVLQQEGLFVYNMDNGVQKHFIISIAPVRSRGGTLVKN
jgi:hypothetical protein